VNESVGYKMCCVFLLVFAALVNCPSYIAFRDSHKEYESFFGVFVVFSVGSYVILMLMLCIWTNSLAFPSFLGEVVMFFLLDVIFGKGMYLRKIGNSWLDLKEV
jgi:hypothetical protein